MSTNGEVRRVYGNSLETDFIDLAPLGFWPD